jgi:hypothetical protein
LRRQADIDFQTLLKTRRVEARQRIAMMQKRKKAAEELAAPSKIMLGAEDSSERSDPTPSQTISYDSTRPEHSSVSFSDPFEALRHACAGLPEETAGLGELIKAWPSLDQSVRESLLKRLGDGQSTEGRLTPASAESLIASTRRFHSSGLPIGRGTAIAARREILSVPCGEFAVDTFVLVAGAPGGDKHTGLVPLNCRALYAGLT